MLYTLHNVDDTKTGWTLVLTALRSMTSLQECHIVVRVPYSKYMWLGKEHLWEDQVLSKSIKYLDDLAVLLYDLPTKDVFVLELIEAKEISHMLKSKGYAVLSNIKVKEHIDGA